MISMRPNDRYEGPFFADTEIEIWGAFEDDLGFFFFFSNSRRGFFVIWAQNQKAGITGPLGGGRGGEGGLQAWIGMEVYIPFSLRRRAELSREQRVDIFILTSSQRPFPMPALSF